MRLICAAFFVLCSFMATANPVKDLVVFGDSLSDNGNLYEYMEHQIPLSPPYFEGRFANGPVWPEKLIDSYFPDQSKSHLLDYAYGGAVVAAKDDQDTVLTLQHEIERYLTAHEGAPKSDSLFSVWIGANNYLGMPEDVNKTVTEVNQGIQESLEALAQKGAKHVLLISMPDLGKLPFAIEFGYEKVLSTFSDRHNALLAKTVADMQTKYPDTQWLYFDVNQVLSNVISHPEDYGLSDVRTPCYNSVAHYKRPPSFSKMVSDARVQEPMPNCKGYLFFDLVHPTEEAHRLMTQQLRRFLDDAGVEFIG